MSGYSGYSKSNRALEAEQGGLLPASKLHIKSVPAGAVLALARYEEWHHTSSKYNRTRYFNRDYVVAFFSTAEGKARLDSWKAKQAEQTYEGCSVEWLDWTDKRPETIKVENAKVTIKGQTAIIKFTQHWMFKGKRKQRTNKITKRLTTTGLYIFDQGGNKLHRPSTF